MATKECEEETLQTAFKKLRVDAESVASAVPVCETALSRTSPRATAEGAKTKMTCLKENWHGGMRRSARGMARNQRRRRSKSPILHPPKFTYCGSKLASPPGHLKHKSPDEPADLCTSLRIPAKKELLSPGRAPGSPVPGARGYELQASASQQDSPGSQLLSLQSQSDEEGGSPGSTSLASPRAHHSFASPDGDPEGKESADGDGAAAAAPSVAAPAADFESLSRLQEVSACPCRQAGCQCPGWQGVEVYSFTGLRNVISECERNLPSPEDAGASGGTQTAQRSRTQNSSASAGSLRSCSEQARAYVDDITIEDLSGYMEYYLYIPKKMSHMAEMMYT